MARIYGLTTKIDSFTWTNAGSAPYICENPTINDKMFGGFTRAIRITTAEENQSELFEDMDLATYHENLIIEIKGNSAADLANLIKDIKEGARSFPPDSDYNKILTGVVKKDFKNAYKFSAVMPISVMLNGTI